MTDFGINMKGVSSKELKADREYNDRTLLKYNMSKILTGMSAEATAEASYQVPKSLKQTPPKPMSMSSYQKKKDQQLRDLRKQSKQNERLKADLEAKTREQQLDKAHKLTQGNPLAFDESRFYQENMTRLRHKYLAEYYVSPKK